MEAEKKYYVGQFAAYQAKLYEEDLSPKEHVFIDRAEKLSGLPKSIQIRSIGPIEDSRKIVLHLRAMGFTNTTR